MCTFQGNASSNGKKTVRKRTFSEINDWNNFDDLKENGFVPVRKKRALHRNAFQENGNTYFNGENSTESRSLNEWTYMDWTAQDTNESDSNMDWTDDQAVEILSMDDSCETAMDWKSDDLSQENQLPGVRLEEEIWHHPANLAKRYKRHKRNCAIRRALK